MTNTYFYVMINRISIYSHLKHFIKISIPITPTKSRTDLKRPLVVNTLEIFPTRHFLIMMTHSNKCANIKRYD